LVTGPDGVLTPGQTGRLTVCRKINLSLSSGTGLEERRILPWRFVVLTTQHLYQQKLALTSLGRYSSLADYECGLRQLSSPARIVQSRVQISTEALYIFTFFSVCVVACVDNGGLIPLPRSRANFV
jgi:hypothetical protein